LGDKCKIGSQGVDSERELELGGATEGEVKKISRFFAMDRPERKPLQKKGKRWKRMLGKGKSSLSAFVAQAAYGHQNFDVSSQLCVDLGPTHVDRPESFIFRTLTHVDIMILVSKKQRHL